MRLHLSPQMFIMVSLFIVRGKRNSPHSYSFIHWWFIYSFSFIHDSFILRFQLVMVRFLCTPNHITWAIVFTFWWLVLLRIHCHYSLSSSSKLNCSLKVRRKHCHHRRRGNLIPSIWISLNDCASSVNISYDHKFLTIYKGKVILCLIIAMQTITLPLFLVCDTYTPLIILVNYLDYWSKADGI